MIYYVIAILLLLILFALIVISTFLHSIDETVGNFLDSLKEKQNKTNISEMVDYYSSLYNFVKGNNAYFVMKKHIDLLNKKDESQLDKSFSTTGDTFCDSYEKKGEDKENGNN